MAWGAAVRQRIGPTKAVTCKALDFRLIFNDVHGGPKKRGHCVLRLVTLEVLTITLAPNLAQINVISFLTLPRSSVTLTNACRFKCPDNVEIFQQIFDEKMTVTPIICLKIVVEKYA